jgi:HPr kinase/phosphorylase
MEIRGVGIVDIQSLFGIRAIRKEKQLDVLVELIDWTHEIDYERIGIEESYIQILNVPIQKVVIPVSPGKNIPVISEVVAMNVLLRIGGINSAKIFNNRLIAAMQDSKKSG